MPSRIWFPAAAVHAGCRSRFLKPAFPNEMMFHALPLGTFGYP
jgi:hypothetical protein